MDIGSPELSAWLRASDTATDSYIHTLLVEDAAQREAGLAALSVLAGEAHRDARERLERLLEPTLDPLGGEPLVGRLRYPEALHTSVLQGYLGELLAGLIAVNYEPHGRSWVVPAFLFRSHHAAFQDLERRRQLGGPARPLPGRTGDDALAFELDEDYAIVAWLWGEAKCTHDHDAGMIAAGHAQLSSAIRIPVDLAQIIDILAEQDTTESRQWVASLRELLYASPSDSPPRRDMLVYVCGRKPVRNTSWIPPDAPNENYTAGQPLQAVEVHLDEFDTVLVACYPGHVIDRG